MSHHPLWWWLVRKLAFLTFGKGRASLHKLGLDQPYTTSWPNLTLRWCVSHHHLWWWLVSQKGGWAKLGLSKLGWATLHRGEQPYTSYTQVIHKLYTSYTQVIHKLYTSYTKVRQSWHYLRSTEGRGNQPLVCYAERSYGRGIRFGLASVYGGSS